MPRGRPAGPEQLDVVVDAAGRVFARLGFRRTRMADIAREAGLSAGALYTYVEGKEALFHLVIAATRPERFPVPNPDPERTLAEIAGRFEAIARQRHAATVTETAPPADPRGEATLVFGGMYDIVASNRRFLAVVERSAADLPGLGDEYYRRVRRSFVSDLAGYLDHRIAQQVFRPVPDTAVTARYLIEAAAWFAWHRHDDPDSAMIGDDAARATVIDMAVAALVVRR